MIDTLERLDPFSISQTDFAFPPSKQVVECAYHTPYFAIQKGERVYAIVQGSCHHWDCPRCGQLRAKAEYGRIVSGCMELQQQGHELYFITITTRGAGLSVKEAETGYLEWTNRLLTRLRTKTKRDGCYWCYVQVTERQKRKHPHSHILTTYKPHDTYQGKRTKWMTDNEGQKKWIEQDCILSDYLAESVVSAGLGKVYDFSVVRDAAAVSRYVGKYLFKASLLTTWPDHWRRVRYSQNWPDLDREKTSAIPLIKKADWFQLATIADTVICHEDRDAATAQNFLWSYPVTVKLKNRQVA